MPVTIYHNPNCSTSRKVLGWLKEKGIEPKVVEYLKTPPDAATLKRILKQMKAKPADILRRKGDAYEALGDVSKLGDEALIAKMDGLQTQNRDLLDQLAETNRDLMKLEFRVDTHSESFRPMPVSEERRFTSVDEEPGVLPPRAEPVSFPTHE